MHSSLLKKFRSTSALGVFAALALAAAPAKAAPAEYEIDAAHSEILFKVKHMGLSTVTGRFNTFSGSFTVDPKSIKDTKGQALIEVKSINTGNEKRDGHLVSPEFFDAGKFPEIRFVSKEVKDVNEKDSTCTLVGDLTMKGVTKAIQLKVKGEGLAKDPWGNQKAAFAAKGVINRQDFGLSWNKALETGGVMVSNEVNLELNFQGTQKKAEGGDKPAETKAGKADKKATKK